MNRSMTIVSRAPHARVTAGVRTASVKSQARPAEVTGKATPADVQASAVLLVDTDDLTFVADENLGGQRVVFVLGDRARHADALDLDHADAVVGLTLHAATAGAPVTVRSAGDVLEASWNWVVSEPLFLGRNGTLTQAPDPVGATLELGVATAPDRVLLRIQRPIFPPS